MKTSTNEGHVHQFSPPFEITISRMAPVTTFKALAVVFAVALFSAAALAQESTLSPAPAPAAGAAGSVSASLAMIGASIVMSMVAILKQ
ncbi:hypothetical protein K1719_012675 [Acacia pycnantha]|nr:hypothetical protein K1719_012675 [Acacia pycnantha]